MLDSGDRLAPNTYQHTPNAVGLPALNVYTEEERVLRPRRGSRAAERAWSSRPGQLRESVHFANSMYHDSRFPREPTIVMGQWIPPFPSHVYSEAPVAFNDARRPMHGRE